MLRIHTSTSPSIAKSYFSTADYYSEGQELRGIWHGEGAKQLGLTGEIKQKDWDQLCDNRDPATGKALTVRRKANRRVGWDCTFDVPKSVSLLYGLTGDERLLDAFRASVDETMLDIEAEAKTRVRTGGKDEDRTTANLAVGQYVHFTSRPVDSVPDPQLHAHCFVFNATYDQQESRWKALQFGDVKRDAPYFQALMDARLARKLADMGLPIQRTQKGWQIEGLDRKTLEKFSRRTAQIEALARKKGITDPKLKAELGAKTRDAKAKELTMPELRQEWRDRLTDDESAAVGTLSKGIGSASIALDEGIMKDAVQRAADHCFQRSAVLPERTLVAEALRQAIGTAEPERIAEELDGHNLIYRERDGRTFVTSWEVLKEENAMLDFARSGRGTCRPLGLDQYTPKRGWLSDEQKAAAHLLLSSPDRVMLLRGAAGTGKTTLMQEAVEGIRDGGKQVYTFAPSASASHGTLREDAGFADADTVAQLLVNPELQEKARDQVLWIDEAGLMGSKEAKQVFDLAERVNARVILSGDRKQHSSVDRGGVLKLLETEAGLVPAELRHIRRQSGEYKLAVQAISDGKIEEGFRRLSDLGWIQEIGDADRDNTIAAAYLQSTQKPGSTLVVCPSHAEADRVTTCIREQLKATKKLGAFDRAFTTLKPLHLTEAQKRDPVSYLPGDVVIFHQNARGHKRGERLTMGKQPVPYEHAERFSVYRSACIGLAAGDRVRVTKNDRKQRLNNGDLRTIERFTPRGEILLDNGSVLSPKDGLHLNYGYVVTSHSAQGKSVDRAILAQSSTSLGASNMQQFYVSVSRAKKELRVFTDDQHALLDAVRRSDDRTTATELINDKSYRRLPRRHPGRTNAAHPAIRDARDHGHRMPHRERSELTHER